MLDLQRRYEFEQDFLVAKDPRRLLQASQRPPDLVHVEPAEYAARHLENGADAT